MKNLYNKILESLLDSDATVKRSADEHAFVPFIVSVLRKHFDIDRSAYPHSIDRDVIPFAAIKDFKHQAYSYVNRDMDIKLDLITRELKPRRIKVIHTVETKDMIVGYTGYTQKIYTIAFTRRNRGKVQELTIVIENIFTSKIQPGGDPSRRTLDCTQTNLSSPNAEIKEKYLYESLLDSDDEIKKIGEKYNDVAEILKIFKNNIESLKFQKMDRTGYEGEYYLRYDLKRLTLNQFRTIVNDLKILLDGSSKYSVGDSWGDSKITVFSHDQEVFGEIVTREIQRKPFFKIYGKKTNLEVIKNILDK